MDDKKRLDMPALCGTLIYMKHRSEKMTLRSIRIPASIDARLDALAAKTGRTKTYYIQEMIRTSLSDLEDYYLADAVAERVRAGTERVYSLEEVESELGLDD